MSKECELYMTKGKPICRRTRVKQIDPIDILDRVEAIITKLLNYKHQNVHIKHNVNVKKKNKTTPPPAPPPPAPPPPPRPKQKSPPKPRKKSLNKKPPASNGRGELLNELTRRIAARKVN